jgi:Rieske Fe-S protein
MTTLLTRRSALRGTLVALAGGVAGFLLARNSDAAKQPRGTTAANAYGAGSADTGQPLAALASIPEGGGRILQHPPVVLVRPAAAQVHAFSAICTHQGCTVTTIEGAMIDCPCHGSRFDLTTGRVVTGPASRPLPPIEVQVRAGQVYRS